MDSDVNWLYLEVLPRLKKGASSTSTILHSPI